MNILNLNTNLLFKKEDFVKKETSFNIRSVVQKILTVVGGRVAVSIKSFFKKKIIICQVFLNSLSTHERFTSCNRETRDGMLHHWNFSWQFILHPMKNEKIVSSHRRPDKIHFFLNNKRRGMSRLCGAISMNGQKLEKNK